MTRLTDAALETRLRAALGPIAREAPLPADALRVPLAWIRGEPVSGRVGRVAFVAAAAVVVTLTVLALLGQLAPPRVGDDGDAALPVEWIDTEPTVLRVPGIVGIQAGPNAEVVQLAVGRADGQTFRLAAWGGSDGTCLWFSWAGSSGSGCGPLPQEGPIAGGALGQVSGNWSGETAGHLDGLAAPGAAAVHVEAVDGRRATAHLLELSAARIDARAFVVFLPAGFTAREVVATNADGAPIGSLDLAGPPEAPPPGQRGTEPRLVAVLRNHTDAEAELEMEDAGEQSGGSSVGVTMPCDIGALGAPLYSGRTWSIGVDGQVLLTSDDVDAQPGSGEAYEVVIDLRPGETPEVVEKGLRPLVESAEGPPSGRDPMPWWSDRMWELADGLECAFEPGR